MSAGQPPCGVRPVVGPGLDEADACGGSSLRRAASTQPAGAAARDEHVEGLGQGGEPSPRRRVLRALDGADIASARYRLAP